MYLILFISRYKSVSIDFRLCWRYKCSDKVAATAYDCLSVLSNNARSNDRRQPSTVADPDYETMSAV